ncbi:MAG: hypothetical protein KGR26_14505, partial [Cyanobacteria bacterium REEB65]|nr:hypothetical protein [Cyanobacteria bacterium REEB65]
YKKPIPMPVLLTVREISKAFPSAQFFVSDEASEMPGAPKDPFLLVRLHGENFIVERWDEPGFVPKK